MQNLRPQPDLLNQNQHFYKIPNSGAQGIANSSWDREVQKIISSSVLFFCTKINIQTNYLPNIGSY